LRRLPQLGRPDAPLFRRAAPASTWSARGYPPSDAPQREALWQAFFERDAIAVLDAARVDKATSWLSMGGYTALMRCPVSRTRDFHARLPAPALERSIYARASVGTHVAAAAFERAGKIDAEAVGVKPDARAAAK